MRQGHWTVEDLIGNGGHIRTVPIPERVKAALDQWIRAAGVTVVCGSQSERIAGDFRAAGLQHVRVFAAAILKMG